MLAKGPEVTQPPPVPWGRTIFSPMEEEGDDCQLVFFLFRGFLFPHNAQEASSSIGDEEIIRKEKRRGKQENLPTSAEVLALMTISSASV